MLFVDAFLPWTSLPFNVVVVPRSLSNLLTIVPDVAFSVPVSYSVLKIMKEKNGDSKAGGAWGMQKGAR